MKQFTRGFLVVALLLASIPAAARTLEKTFDERYSLPAGASVDVSNVNGSINLEAWDGNEVWVRAELELEARNERLAREAFEDLKVEVREEANGLSIRAKHPRERRGGFLSWFRGDSINSSIRFEIRVPRELELDLSTVNGRLVVTGTRGRLEASTVNGSIRIYDAGGALEAETVNGSVEIELSELGVAEDVRISTVNGSVELDLPDTVGLDVRATTTNGRIRSELPLTMTEKSRHRLVGQINGGGAQLRLSTTNGSIKIR